MSNLDAAQADAWMPDPHLLRVEVSKIIDYLLNVDHVDGRGKAKFFRAVGFSDQAAGAMIEALRGHAATNKISQVVEHAYGVKSVVECFMETPSGKSYCVRTIWNDHLDGQPPKLVTALPVSPTLNERAVCQP